MATCTRKKSPLPYAAFISKILKTFNINPSMHTREDSTIIDSNSLRMMNFSLIGNTWKRNAENLTIKRARERRETEAEENEDGMEVDEDEAETKAQTEHEGGAS